MITTHTSPRTRRHACITLCTALLAAVLLLPTAVRADPIFSVYEFDDGNVAGWYSDNSVGNVSAPLSGGNPNGYIDMSFPGSAFPSVENDILRNDDANFTGDYAQHSDLWATFDFLGYDSSAQALLVRSPQGGTTVWSHDIVSSSHAWESEAINLRDSSGWTRIMGSADFDTAMGDVDSIGISVEHLNFGSPYSYGIDNWQYHDYDINVIPEPSTIVLGLTAVLMGAGVRFRRQRS